MFSIPRGIIPQNFSLLGLAVLEELRNKHPNRQTHSLTHWQTGALIERFQYEFHYKCKEDELSCSCLLIDFQGNLFLYASIGVLYIHTHSLVWCIHGWEYDYVCKAEKRWRKMIVCYKYYWCVYLLILMYKTELKSPQHFVKFLLWILILLHGKIISKTR